MEAEFVGGPLDGAMVRIEDERAEDCKTARMVVDDCQWVYIYTRRKQKGGAYRYHYSPGRTRREQANMQADLDENTDE